MSKYINVERLNEEWQTLKPFGITDTLIDNLKWIVGRQPTIEVSEDAISRKWLEEHKKVISYTNGWRETETDEFVSWDNIEGAPPVIPKPKEGEWVLECDAEGEGDNLYRCPKCGQRCGCQEYDLPNFCGHCGARLKGADDE